MNVQPGHRLAVFTGTTALHVSLHAAAHKQQFTLVPMPLRDAPEALAAHLEATGADAVVTDKAHAALAHQVRGGRPVLLCDDDGTPVSEVEGHLDPPASTDTYAALRTSGTTGPPKVVDLPRDALAAHAAAAKKRLGATPESVWLACLPLWHVGGVALVHRCLHGGGRLVLQQAFEARAALQAMEAQKVTHVSLVPTMLRRILDLGSSPPANLQCVLVGGDAAAPDLVRQALEAGWPLYASYGLTEACSQVATATPDDLRDDPATCGHPLDGVRLTIQDASGQVLEPEEVGEIVVDGPTLAVPGPLRTGDLGRLDAAGRLSVLGRADDRITTGGEKVDPERVEAALLAHPHVAEAAVVGVPDKEWGQRVVAAVVGDVDGEALLQDVRGRLAAHEVPKEVRVVQELPRTGGGKLRRQALRDQWPPG